jgi:hypothetical protein
MQLNHYAFRSVWSVDAPKTAVFSVLADLTTYPAWWPEIRRVEKLEDARFQMTCRSLLPYNLLFESIQDRRDPDEGVLQARLTGDLDGFSRWTVRSDAGIVTAVFDEEVTATKALLRYLAPAARPAFRANHALMMRHGQAGLRVYLAGYTAAGTSDPL